MVIYSESENLENIATIKELHSLVKTKGCYLDLPFIVNLSKYYDISKFDNSVPNIPTSSACTFRDNMQNIINNPLQKDYTRCEYEGSENQFNYNAIKNIDLNDTINSLSKYNNIDDDVMKSMQAQIPN